MPDDPFENHPLFKTEEQARVEDTMDGVPSIVDEPTQLDWPVASEMVTAPSTEDGPRPLTSLRTRISGRARATSTGRLAPTTRGVGRWPCSRPPARVAVLREWGRAIR